ncbi:MAG: mrr restriction system protein [Dehalococcoidia bacterium]|nr:mrr restriction system protein [Dehalococcoidia bacterium]
MAIPDYQTIMLPLLKLLEDKQEHSLRQVIDSLADQFKLTPEEQRELLPSGRQAKFDNRVGWARTYMKKAGLLESTRRGSFCITDRGLELVNRTPARIDVKFLEQFKEFSEFRAIKRERSIEDRQPQEELSTTPEEALANAYQRIRDGVADDLLQQLKGSSPTRFENIVIDLLVAMGYGGSRKDAARAIGRTGDEGVDGIINEDRLGLDVIYVQAKKWEGIVGRPEIQKFAGALQGQRARKGIFITTSQFSREALDFTSRIDSKIVLIDGEALVQFMIDHNIGVSSSATYEIKRIDSDYFTE